MEEGHVLHGIPVFLLGGLFLLWMHLGKGLGVLEATRESSVIVNEEGPVELENRSCRMGEKEEI